MKRISLIIFAFSVALAGCRFFASEGTLEGSVFVVTDSSEFVRFGSIRVLVFTESQIENALKSRRPIVQSELQLLRDKMSQAVTDSSLSKKLMTEVEGKEAKAAEKEEKADEVLRLQRAFVQSTSTGTSSGVETAKWNERVQQYLGEWRRLVTERTALTNSAAKLRNEAVRLALRSSETMMEREQWPNRCARLFFDGLPTPAFSTQTDDKGSFSMRIPKRSRFALAVSAVRQVEDFNEQRFWLVWVSLGSEKTKFILLSNGNQFDSGDSDSVVKPIAP